MHTARTLHLFRLLARIKVRRVLAQLRSHRQRLQYCRILDRLANAFVVARALSRWGACCRSRLEWPELLERGAEAQQRIERAGAWRRWSSHMYDRRWIADAMLLALSRKRALTLRWWRARARVAVHYSALSRRTAAYAVRMAKLRALSCWAAAAQRAIANDGRICAMRCRVHSAQAVAAFHLWWLTAVCSATEPLRRAALRGAWDRLKRSLYVWSQHRAASFSAAAAFSTCARRRTVRQWQGRARSRRVRHALLLSALRCHSRRHCTSAMAAMRSAALMHAAAGIGRRQVLAIALVGWRRRAFQLTFRASGARAFRSDVVSWCIRLRVLRTIFQVWLADAARRTEALAMFERECEHMLWRARYGAIDRWRRDVAAKRQLARVASAVRWRACKHELRVRFDAWLEEATRKMVIKVHMSKTVLRRLVGMVRRAFSSWHRVSHREAAWNALLGAVLNARLSTTSVDRIMGQCEGYDVLGVPGASAVAIASKEGLEGSPSVRRRREWTPALVRHAVAASGSRRVRSTAFATWRKEWHLSRRFVRVATLLDVPPLPPAEAAAAKRSAFREWRFWRWVHVQERASVALAFCTWYLHGRALQLAVPVSRDGSAQSPAIFWTGAASIRDLLFTQ